MRRRRILHGRRAGVAVALIAVLTSACAQTLQPLSTGEALERLNVATTKVYAADGSLIADLHGEINREIVELTDIPDHVQNAVISIEDQRFWTHFGVDPISVVRAAVSNIESAARNIQRLEGASTLSQQLVKNLYFPEPARTMERKLVEARVTLEFEQQYEKAQILEMYLNTIFLGRGLYGFQTAARSYFRKHVSDLTLSEGAFLAGIIHEPSRYDWVARSSAEEREARKRAALGRRGVVLSKMAELGLVSEEEARAAAEEDLEIHPRVETEWRYPYFVDMVLRQLGVLRSNQTAELDPRFEFLGDSFNERSRNVYRGGLRIYTTLDPRMQDAAQEAVAQVVPGHLDKLSASLAAIEPSSGHVKALVGGRSYYPECDPDLPEREQSVECRIAKLNLALGPQGGGSGRQPGSSLKPVVLAAALQRGIPLTATYDGSPFTHTFRGQSWRVSNYEGSGGGHQNLIEATVRSVNASFARLAIDGIGEGDALQGSAAVADLSRRMGVGFPTPEELRNTCGDDYNRIDRCIPADNVPAMVLGAKEVSPLEMATVYATFANEGVAMQPTAITRITDARGEVLFEANPQGDRAMARGVALGVTHVLAQAVQRGTGVRARISRPAAGKTGTSQEWRDAWFGGYVPQLAAAVWVGNPIADPRIESMTPANGYPFRVVGGSFPAMIWSYFMTKALADMPVEQFPAPPSDIFTRAPVAATPGPLQPVPDVLGNTRDEAASALHSAGFGSNETSCLARGWPEGVVVQQTPAGGSEASRGSSVTICISTQRLPGPDDQDDDAQPSPSPRPGMPTPAPPGGGGGGGSQASATVPNVVGQSVARAQSDLQQAGFEAALVRECDPAGAQPGYVWRQNPGGGSRAAAGSAVTIWYSPAGC